MHVQRPHTQTSMISISNGRLTPRLENTTPVVCNPGVTVELEPVLSDDKQTNKQKQGN